MKKKVGRPRKPKGTAKKTVFSAKLSGDDSKSIEAHLRATGKTKSEFLRDSVLEKIGQQTVKRFLESLICRDLKDDEPPPEVEATLTADGQPPSRGQLSLGSALGEPGHYYPTEPSILDKYPLRGAVLKLSGRIERLSVKHLQRCMTSTRPAYHLWFESVEK